MNDENTLTMFSFGYHGWGNCTEELDRAATAVERSRGFKPPLFVDARIRRNVRAKGFLGRAFEDLLGTNRYVWMKGLGNRAVRDRTGGMVIDQPKEAQTLLDLALKNWEENRRVIFFCSCGAVKEDGEIKCHRWAVGALLLKAARKAEVPLHLIEWPGDQPQLRELRVEPGIFRAVSKGRARLPLGELTQLARWSGLPHGSPITLKCEKQTATILSGPAFYRSGQWFLPVYEKLDLDDDHWDHADAWRKQRGQEYREA